MKTKKYIGKVALIIVACVCGVLTVGCNKNDGVKVLLESGYCDNIDWDDPFGTYQEDVIPNEQVAVNVAIQIFDGISKDSYEEKYIPQLVVFDESCEVWIVTFWPDQSDTNEVTVGGDCNIAIQKKDGKVLRIWWKCNCYMYKQIV